MYSRNQHNIINQLYSNLKKEIGHAETYKQSFSW